MSKLLPTLNTGWTDKGTFALKKQYICCHDDAMRLICVQSCVLEGCSLSLLANLGNATCIPCAESKLHAVTMHILLVFQAYLCVRWKNSSAACAKQYSSNLKYVS